VALSVAFLQNASADPVSEWIERAASAQEAYRANDVPSSVKRFRTMSWVSLAMFEAANATRQPYTSYLGLQKSGTATSEAVAAAAAARSILATLYPDRRQTFDAAFDKETKSITDEAAIEGAIKIGERAAKETLAKGALDPSRPIVPYRPFAVRGVYVPTALPVIEPYVLSLKPWFMSRPDQFRPEGPPKWSSARYARDMNEVKAIGAKNSASRTKDQTQLALYWDRSFLYKIPQQVAMRPDRSIVQNSRMYAAYFMALDDAEVAVAEAKMHFAAWRPITAIRNADRDGNSLTERQADWEPLLVTPLHPEYPCGHCTVAEVIAQIMSAETRDYGQFRYLLSNSKSSPEATYELTSFDDFSRDVSLSRIYGGAHFRYAADDSRTMGRQIGALALQRFALPVKR
jgi:hypothetical protein